MPQEQDRAGHSRIMFPGLLALTIALGLFDGADLASLGLTLSRVSRELHLDPAQGGICAGAGMMGLTIGALCAGRAADLFGKRTVLAIFTILLGIFSLATSMAWDFPSLLVARFVSGLGMGGVMPVLLAMAAASAYPRARAFAVSGLMASGGVGAILASVVSLVPDWRFVFYFGGLGPMLLLPILLILMPRYALDAEHPAGQPVISFRHAMFGGGRALGTSLIWMVAFCTTLVSYILINWLPSLLVRQGFSEHDSHTAMIAYSIGGVVGNLAAGIATDRGGARLTYVVAYLGGMLCILGLATTALGMSEVYALAFGTNLFILGAQLVTLALGPVFYPRHAQTTGMGAIVAAGRLGSVVGPFAVGQFLHAGFTANQVLLALIPALLLPLILSVWLARIIGGKPVVPESAVGDLAASAA